MSTPRLSEVGWFSGISSLDLFKTEPVLFYQGI